ncbi:MAG: UTP--glucose-1-phosphate uridylyltransferase [Granulosicoccus sp.]|nr:UTP--glucose-1-phosphate uridylyltransferase [Granulosicoccus sp.]
MSFIKKAVIPVAGLGTRMLPASSTVSKCMFPVVGKPVIQYVVEEAIEAGIEEIVFVVGSNRDAIERYFSDSTLSHMKLLREQCAFHFVVQEQLNGLGGAVLCARDLIGNHTFAVLLGDAIMQGRPPVISQLIEHMVADMGAVIGVEHVPPEKVSRYGIVDVNRISEKLFAVTGLVEKPTLEAAPSNLAIAARYILDAEILTLLDRTKPDAKGEIQLTHAIQSLVQTKPVHALRFSGQRFDIGNKLDFVKTNVAIALDDPNLHHELVGWLQSTLRNKSESTD